MNAQSRSKPPAQENPLRVGALRVRAFDRDLRRAKGIMASGTCKGRTEGRTHDRTGQHVQKLQKILANTGPFSNRTCVVNPAFTCVDCGSCLPWGHGSLRGQQKRLPHNLVRERKCFNVHSEFGQCGCVDASTASREVICPLAGGKATTGWKDRRMIGEGSAVRRWLADPNRMAGR